MVSVNTGTKINTLEILNEGLSSEEFRKRFGPHYDMPITLNSGSEKYDEPIQLVESTDGRYVVSVEVGQGGGSSVFKARDLKLDRDVAIKVPNWTINDERAFDSHQEGINGVQFDHPNIAKTYDFTVVKLKDGYHPVIVEEYMSGKTLLQDIADGTLYGQISENTVFHKDILNIMNQVADGIDYIHKSGFIHRDIKLTNIMRTQELNVNGTPTDNFITKLVDNSLAISISAAKSNQPIDQIGVFDYMSPHLHNYERPRKCDDYWAGLVCLYYMAFETFPFDPKVEEDSKRHIYLDKLHKVEDTNRGFRYYNQRLELDEFFKNAFTNYEKYSSFKDIVEEFEKAVK